MAIPPSLPIALQIAGVFGSLFVGVLAFPTVDFGFWPRVELPTVALWLTAGLAAIGLALEGGRLPTGFARSPLALSLAGLVAMTLLLAPFARYPWLSLTGAPQGGEGGLRYLAILVLVASALRLRREKALRSALLWAATAALLAALLPLYVDLGSGPLFVFREYLAYPAIALATMALAELSGAEESSQVWSQRMPGLLALATALAVLVISTNRSAWLGCLGAGLLAAIAFRQTRSSNSQPPRLTAALALGVAHWAVLFAIVWIGLDAPVESLRARMRVLTVLFDAVATSPAIWIGGSGWGLTTELFALHMTAAPASLWDGSWDNASRDLFHSHHAGFEAFLSLGLAGAGFWTLGLVAPLLMGPKNKWAAALFLSGSLTLVDALWFQFPFAAGPIALALVWVIDRDGEPVLAPAQTLRAAVAVSGAALVLSSGLMASWEIRFAEARRALPTVSHSCAELPSEEWRGDIETAYLFDHTLQAYRQAIANPPAKGTGQQTDTLLRLFCAIDARAAVQQSPYLMMVGLLFRNEVAFVPGLPESFRTDLATTWETRVREFLAVAPRRSDLAAPLLAAWVQQRDFSRVTEFARALVTRTPKDAVGLYFLGIARLATAESDAQRRQGVQLLREAVQHGLERIIPIDDNLRNLISMR